MRREIGRAGHSSLLLRLACVTQPPDTAKRHWTLALPSRTVLVRTEQPKDRDFLTAPFRSTAAALPGVNDCLAEGLLGHALPLAAVDLLRHLPECIVSCFGTQSSPFGQLVLDEAAISRIVEHALTPASRGLGLGTASLIGLRHRRGGPVCNSVICTSAASWVTCHRADFKASRGRSRVLRGDGNGLPPLIVRDGLSERRRVRIALLILGREPLRATPVLQPSHTRSVRVPLSGIKGQSGSVLARKARDNGSGQVYCQSHDMHLALGLAGMSYFRRRPHNLEMLLTVAYSETHLESCRAGVPGRASVPAAALANSAVRVQWLCKLQCSNDPARCEVSTANWQLFDRRKACRRTAATTASSSQVLSISE